MLTHDLYTRLKAQAGDRIKPDQVPALYAQFSEIRTFTPPQTYAAWLGATNVHGRIYGTKSRGDRLQAVDRAYKAWIEYPGAEGITHGGNAENLRSALETYTGVIYRMTGKVSGFSHDYRNERNRDGVMTKTLALAGLLTKLCLDSPASDAEKRQADRRAMLSLVANIKVEWNPLMTIVTGAASVAGSTDGLIPKGLARDIVRICEGGVVGIGAIAGGAYAYTSVEDVPGKIKAFLLEHWEKFKTWMSDTFRRFGIANAADLLGKAGQAFALVVKVAMESIANFAAGASDIYQGLKGMITDAWTRRTLGLQQAELGTSDGAFALIRNGIDVGIRNRQVVAAWSIAKGVTTTVVAATATPVASKIADLVLGAFEFIFKLIYNLLEIDRINDFIAQARTMWNHVANAPSPLTPPTPPVTSGPPVHTVQPAFFVPKATTGFMPAFKAAQYTAYDFLTDSKASYLNFLHSLVAASPVLAAIVMNSGAFATIDDIMHAATPRSTDDAQRAATHIKSLEIEAVRLYTDSGYQVVSNTTAMSQADNFVFQPLFNGARLAPAP
jgi:hypothetical protein